MNLQIFNIFLIILSILLALTITVNARFNRPIKKHANKHNIVPTKTKCTTPTPTCCQARNSPGWNNKAFLAPGSLIAFNGLCFHGQNTTTINYCSLPTYEPSSVNVEGGIIRCSGGS
ncbi:4535_t:CDS:2 [Dentiscutata heterogama]|uniref:4535_t:CDS:1 n=1 Tax=Dentiscutata heterogama TaxID=1316150 RepID=A0ACA9LC78_9GLOM|nr:4535_t:CDS:2 [Dentiscutata heterogama]